MELGFAQQSAAFIYSILLGAALGVFYGCLKFIRAAFRLKNVLTAALDILFMLVSSLSLFLLSLGYLSGEVRVYMILGALAGFLLFRLTIGRFLSKIYNPVICVIYSLLNRICLKIKIYAKKLLKIIHKLLYNVNNRRQRINKPDKRTKGEYEEQKAKNKKGFGKFNQVR